MPAVLTFKALDEPRPARTVRSRSLFLHLVDAVRAWRQQAIEDEIGDFIAQQGGRITDDLERQISRRLH